MIQIVEGLLDDAAFAGVRRVVASRRGALDVYGNLQGMRFLEPLRAAVAARFPEVRGLVLHQALLRFEGYTGLLHHDRNHEQDRRFSLIYYVDEPSVGGEIVFPFFGPSGEPISNPVVEACERLRAAGRLYAEDEALERYMLANKEHLLTIPARSNTAVFFRSDDPAAWHFACPVGAGERSCLVLFYLAADPKLPPGNEAGSQE